MKIRPTGAELFIARTDRLTGRHDEDTVAFPTFAKAPKNDGNEIEQYV